MSEILPVIMSGGSGSRLWPLSRADTPKQLLALTSDQTMIQETAQRFAGSAFTDPVFICNARHVDAIGAQMEAAGHGVGACIVEPMGRNTAPVAVIAALYAKSLQTQTGAAPLVLLAPADHHIKDADSFRAAIAKAAPIAKDGYIVTFGITPDGPETGYGYIESGEALGPDIYKVSAFKEKPDKQTAEKYLSAGHYSWNAGIFLYAPDTLLGEAQKYAPAINTSAKAAFTKAAHFEGLGAKDRIDLDADEFAACPPNSIDYAIMEKSDRVAVLPTDMGWNDIGSFQSLHDLTNALSGDGDGNVAQGDVMFEGAAGCFVSTDSLAVSVVGVDNLAVIIRGGEVLVLNLDAAQDVKKIVTRLKADKAQDRL